MAYASHRNLLTGHKSPRSGLKSCDDPTSPSGLCVGDSCDRPHFRFQTLWRLHSGASQPLGACAQTAHPLSITVQTSQVKSSSGARDGPGSAPARSARGARVLESSGFQLVGLAKHLGVNCTWRATCKGKHRILPDSGQSKEAKAGPSSCESLQELLCAAGSECEPKVTAKAQRGRAWSGVGPGLAERPTSPQALSTLIE